MSQKPIKLEYCTSSARYWEFFLHVSQADEQGLNPPHGPSLSSSSSYDDYEHHDHHEHIWTSSAASSSQTIFRVGQRHQEFLGVLIVYGQIFATCPVNSAQRAETSANFNCKSSFAAQVRACIGWNNVHSGKLMVLPSKKGKCLVSGLLYQSVMHIIQAWWAGWLIGTGIDFLCPVH